jgi:fibronectin-binding autotransporter adhesin
VSTFDKVAVTGTNGLTINGVGINLYTSNTVTPWTTTGSYNLFQYNGNLGGLAATNLSSALTVLNPLGSLTYNFSSAGGFITLAIDTVGVTPTWIATGGGSWNTAGNWNTTAPNAQDATAKFGSAISAPSTVTLDGNKTVGVIEFGNTNAYTIAQGTSGTLILSKSSGSAAVDNVSGSHTISAPVSLASPTIVTVFDPADTLTVSGAVSGANSLTKSGLGTLALPSANSFGGGATLTAGTLRIGHNQSLGTAAATVTGNGTLQFGVNNLAPANDVVVNSGATATIDTQSNSATLAGVVSGDGALNKAGSGRLVLLSSANSYNGPTTITAGILSVDNLPDGSFPSPIGQSANDAANLVLNGGTLEYTGTGIFTDRLFHLGTAGGGLAASGTGPVQFINFGAITFAGSNTARTLTLSGTNTDANTLSAVIGNNGTGATSLTKSGAGTWNLGGTNTFSGETVISGGTLVLDNPSALGGSTLNYNNQGGVLDFGFQFQVNLGGLTGGQNLPLTNSPSLNIGGNGQSTTYSGSLTGAASLTKAGAGTLTLTGSNELLGNATISGGTLEVGAGGTLVTPTIAFTATSTLFHQTGGTVTADFLNLENGSAQQLRAAFDAGTATFNTTRLGATNATSAPCVLTINGGTIALGNYSSQRDGSANFNTTAGLIIHGGTVTATSVQVSTNNSWSNLTLTAGSLEIGTSASDGAFFLGGGTNNARGGNLNMSGGTLTYQGIDGLVLNRSAGSSIGQATFSGGTANLSGITLNAATATGGSSTLNITGGTVYLGPVGLQANTVGGATATATLNGGILGASDDWTGNANLTLGANGATFQAADEANIAHDITLSGQLSGSGSVTKTGLGTLTLNGQNTYAGATVVDAGTLVLGQSLTTSSLSIAEGATVQLAAAASPAEAVEATATFDWTDNGNPMQQIIAAGGVAVVPEPGALSLLMIGALAWLSRRC